MALADWTMLRGRGDLMAPHRGLYQDREGAERRILDHCDLVGFVRRGAVVIGLTELAAPEAGAIGVIGSPKVPLRQWGAIFDDRRWMVRMADGFGPLTAPMLGVWGV